MNSLRGFFCASRLTLLLGLLFVVALGPELRASGAEDGRVILLGFDGADARTTAELMEQGLLPNLTRLAEQGTFAPLTSTNPAESASGWAAINTGVNPAKNGVPSFIVRKLEGGPPSPNMGHVEISSSRPIEEFEHSGLMKLLVDYDGTTLAVGAGLLVWLLFAVVFAGLLRVKKVLAMVLALVLGGAGAWGALRASAYVPRTVPDVYGNRVKSEGFWNIAARSGAPTIALDAALAFDQPGEEGARVLGGLGLPDIRGGSNGEWFIYTTDDLELSRPPKGDQTGTSSGFVFRVDERDGKMTSQVYGPVNFWERDKLQRELDEIEGQLEDPDLGWKESNALRKREEELSGELKSFRLKKYDHRVTLPLVAERSGDKLQVTLDGHTQDLGEGEWSDWYRLTFQINPLIRAKAITRVKVLSLEEPLELYVNTLDIDPSEPPFWQPVSQPASFSAELVDWIQEPYETLGWACMTNQIKDKKIDVETFLEDVEFTMAWRKKLTFAALERGDWRVLFSVFSTTDRVQHMMYKYYDAGHPYYKEEEASRKVTFFGEEIALKDAIPAIYRQMDQVVGRVMDDYLGPDDVLLLCADHGFTSFRRGLHVNNWLAEKGYLTVKEGVKKTEGSILSLYPDWSRTQAYAVGLGMVFLNLEGREPDGIVKRDEADALLERIRADFLAEVDPETGLNVGHDATIMKDVYPGPWGTEDYQCADLMLGFAENYRVSWSTVTGKISLTSDAEGARPRSAYTNNSNNWSGDHASVSPQVVQGIFFSSRPVEVPEDGVSVLHIAPTVLGRVGAEIPADFDRPPLVFSE